MSVNFVFKGQMNNEDIHKFYNENAIDCFISTSSSEGLPISIMEAMSYGIPIIAPNVGGIRELVNDENGVLLSDNPSISEISGAIIKIIDANCAYKYELRKSSIKKWNKYFDAKENAKKLTNYIVKNYGNDVSTVIMTIDSLSADWCFVEAEIDELSNQFHVVLIETKVCHDNKENVIVKDCIHKTNCGIELYQYYPCNARYILLKHLIPFFFDANTKVERDEIRSLKEKRSACLWESIKYYALAEEFYKWIYEQRILREDEKTVFYSFWYQDVTLAMCMHMNAGIVLTRTHGYDLYNERYKKGSRQPFRSYMNEKLNDIFFVSEAGKKYYIQNWSNTDLDKIHVFYLGSNSLNVESNIVYGNSNDVIRIVSCSSIIPLKRIDRIIDALSIVKEKLPEKHIEWIHFGDGELKEYMEIYARKILKNAYEKR